MSTPTAEQLAAAVDAAFAAWENAITQYENTGKRSDRAKVEQAKENTARLRKLHLAAQRAESRR